jgi:glycosyltransferase involved in cell wall biosynthesis
MQDGRIKVWLPAIRVGSGTDVFTERLADALTRHGILTEITWFSSKFEFAPFLLRSVQPPAGTDIVLANSWNGFAFKRPDIPLIVTLHHSGFDPTVHFYRTLTQRIYHRLLIEPYERWSYKAANAVTAVSTFSANSLKQATGLAKVEVIHNWIDTERFRPMASAHPGDTRPFRLLFVGKPSVSKGADLLAPIMRRLGPEFELRIAGRTNPAQQAEYPTNIRVLGWLNEEKLIRSYQESDALLFPSRSEGFGYVALEAMACGKPVIATDCTAIPEVVSNCVTGLLCAPGDVIAFADACRHLADSPLRRMEMSQAARQKAIEEFSESVVLPRYVNLIQRLTGR